MTDEEMALKWVLLKNKEKEVIEERRQLEDKMSSLFGIAENFKGTQKLEAGKVNIKIVGSLTTSVNREILTDILSENPDIDGNLIFRWKPEVEKKVYDTLDEKTKQILSKAITSKPARLSYTIELKEELNNG
jgi:hypothetical protein